MAISDDIVTLEAKYSELISGGSARVYVDQNGERVEYNAGNRLALLARIEALKSEARSAATGPTRPLRFWF